MDKARQGLQRDQLLPGLPDDLVLQSVVPRLPYHARARAEGLSRSWRDMLLRQEGDLEEQQRWRLALVCRGLLLRHGASCTLNFLDFADMHTHPLPPLPFAHRGLGATFAFAFCVNGRIFAAQRSAVSSIQRLYMLDVAAGLFRWQQRFGPPSRLHRRHVGDARGSIQVSSPYKCIIVGFKVYVVAERLPASLYSMDKLEAIRYFTKSKDGIAAAMYDACEDTWEEIPSPLGNSFTAQLGFLGSSSTGVIARVYDNQGHYYHDNTTLLFAHTHKQWCDIGKVTDATWPALAFSTHSYLHFSIFAKDDEAVCTCCGAPAIGRSWEPVDPEDLVYCKYLYKACRCHFEPQPGVANGVVAILSKLRWSVPLRSPNDESDESADDEEGTDETDHAIWAQDAMNF